MSLTSTTIVPKIPTDPAEIIALCTEQARQIQHLQHELAQLKRMIFGQKGQGVSGL